VLNKKEKFEGTANRSRLETELRNFKSEYAYSYLNERVFSL